MGQEPVRVVLDTNVLVSALLFGGVSGRLVEEWKAGRILPLVSAAMLDEYLRVLAYPKFGLGREEIDYLLQVEVLPWFEAVDAQSGPALVRDDPEDDKFLWCAVSGKARAVISGDAHLLALPDPPVPVLAPAQFLAGQGKTNIRSKRGFVPGIDTTVERDDDRDLD